MKIDKEESKRVGIKVLRKDSKPAEKVEKSEKKKKSHEIFEEKEEAENLSFRDEE